MKKLLTLCAIASLSLSAQGQSNNGDSYWESITCGGVKADLMINHRTVAQPTLFLNGKAMQLEDGPTYTGPVCLTFQGNPVIGFVESMGNAYETYRIIDIDTFQVREITYEQAEKIGWWR